MKKFIFSSLTFFILLLHAEEPKTYTSIKTLLVCTPTKTIIIKKGDMFEKKLTDKERADIAIKVTYTLPSKRHLTSKETEDISWGRNVESIFITFRSGKMYFPEGNQTIFFVETSGLEYDGNFGYINFYPFSGEYVEHLTVDGTSVSNFGSCSTIHPLLQFNKTREERGAGFAKIRKDWKSGKIKEPAPKELSTREREELVNLLKKKGWKGEEITLEILQKYLNK